MKMDLSEKIKKIKPPKNFFQNKFDSNLQKEIPARAKDKKTMMETEQLLRRLPTIHKLILGDSRDLSFIHEDVHLVVTSPPYWTIKDYEPRKGQLGVIKDYEEFHSELNKVWKECFDLLVPGGRMVVVVGDAILARRKAGRHQVFPNHSDIQVRCREIGFESLAPIIWYKIGNISREVDRGKYLGKPYEPNAIVKNDIEYIIFFRKPGYRSPSEEKRKLSIIPEEKQRKWFQQIWEIQGASTKDHPAPFPVKLAERLIRMFSFADDVVLDPFAGIGSTNVATIKSGRNSIGIEIDGEFFEKMKKRVESEAVSLYGDVEVKTENHLE